MSVFHRAICAQRRWSEMWKSGSVSNRWHRKRRGYIRRGSFAPLLRSPGGRPACIASPPSHPPPAGPCFDRCCPCCPEKCTCRSTEVSDQKHSALQPLCCAFRIECILTPYHREYNRAHIMSSRMTRCHDTSSPAECWEKSNIIGLWLIHNNFNPWIPFETHTHELL